MREEHEAHISQSAFSSLDQYKASKHKDILDTVCSMLGCEVDKLVAAVFDLKARNEQLKKEK